MSRVLWTLAAVIRALIGASGSMAMASYNLVANGDVADVSVVPFVPSQTEFTHMAPSTSGRNLLANGSFDVGASGWSSLGIATGWGNLAHLHGSVVSSSEPDHRWFLRIPLGGGETPILYFDYYQPSVTPQIRCLVASRGWVRVEPGAAYTISCDMRASVDGTPAVLGIVCRNPEDLGRQENPTRSVAVSTKWERYAYTFRPSSRYVFVLAGPTLAEDRRVDMDIDNIQLEKGDRATPFEPGSQIEASLEPSATEGIFTIGEPASLTIHVRSYLSRRVRLSAELKAIDYFGKKVPFASVSVVAEPNTVTEKRIALPATWRGFYRLSPRLRSEAPVALVTPSLRLAFVPKPHDDGFLGMNHAFPDARLIRLACKAGIAWYRDWSLKWQDIEPAPGEWHWNIGDKQIDRVLKERASLMALLPPFPSSEWASEASATPRTNAYPGVRLRQSAAPKDPAKLADFVSRAVARYKDRVRYWEFLNEPIYTDYSLPGRAQNGYLGPTYGTADYVRLLRVAADAMRKSDTDCKVIGGVGAGPGHLTGELMDAGILQLIDILNLHIYPGARDPEAYIPEMDRLLKNMDDHGARRPIWVTEFSYYGVDDLPQTPRVPGEGGWAGERLLGDERKCAEYTIRFLLVMLSHGVEKVFIHSGSSGSVNAPSFECCLFDYGGAPRKVVPALATLADLLGATPHCVKTTVQDKLYAATFENAQKTITAVWCTADTPARVAVPRGAECLDIVGQHIQGSHVEVSSAPVYLIGSAVSTVTIAH